MHMLDVNAPFPTIYHHHSRGEEASATTTTAPEGATYPIRQRPKLPRRTSSSRNNTSASSQSRRGPAAGGRIRKRTPSPPALNRRNATYFDALTATNNKDSTVTLSALDTTHPASPKQNHQKGTTHFPFDPSMYKLRERLLATCLDATNSVTRQQTTSIAEHNDDRVSVELSSGRKFTYNNTQDVLHLRFVVGQSPPPATILSSSEHTPARAPPPPSLTTTPSAPLPGRILHKGITSPSPSPSLSTMHPLSATFQSLWSPPLAKALHNARRIAIDISQLDSDASFSSPRPTDPYHQSRLVQDIVFLACTIQNDLEVLYLVDYSYTAGGRQQWRRCQCTASPVGKETKEQRQPLPVVVVAPTPLPVAAALENPTGKTTSPLYRALHPSSLTSQLPEGRNNNNETETASWDSLLDQDDYHRHPDAIHGVGKTWHEVFDLEALGWHDKHPGFVFGETLGEVIRLQQSNWHGRGDKRPAFKGVRVLVAEDEEVGGVDTTGVLGCGCGRQ